MSLCIGILSSQSDGKIISQLIRSFDVKVNVVIHHDFNQKPDFKLDDDIEATIISNYTRTSWGNWSLVEAELKLIEKALLIPGIKYFQILSETCLLLRPLSEFIDYLSINEPDACIGLIKVGQTAGDIGALNFAWRYSVRTPTARKSLLFASRRFIERPAAYDATARQIIQGVSVGLPATPAKMPYYHLRKYLLQSLLTFYRYQYPFEKDYHCYTGSQWFCLSTACMNLVINELSRNPSIKEFFSNTPCPDEATIQTIIGNSKLNKLLEINHYLSWTERMGGPDQINKSKIREALNSGKFFARKFSSNTHDETRLEILKNIQGKEVNMGHR